MHRFQTIRTRLLSGLTTSALLQLVALAVAVVALFTTSDAVRDVSMQKLPQAGLANSLASASERMADDVGNLISAETDEERQVSFEAFRGRFEESATLFDQLANSMPDASHLTGL